MKLWRSVEVSIDDDPVAEINVAFQLDIEPDLDILTNLIERVIVGADVNPTHKSLAVNYFNRSKELGWESEESLVDKIYYLGEALRVIV